MAAEHEQLGDDPSRAEKREQSGRDLQQIRKALGDKTTPRIPVAIIDRVEFSNANTVKNGRITIHVGDKKAIFHYPAQDKGSGARASRRAGRDQLVQHVTIGGPIRGDRRPATRYRTERTSPIQGLISIGPSGSSRYWLDRRGRAVLEDGRLAGAAALHAGPRPLEQSGEEGLGVPEP